MIRVHITSRLHPLYQSVSRAALKARGIELRHGLAKADLVLSSRPDRWFTLIRALRIRPTLIWTNEPRYDSSPPAKARAWRTRTMNVFSGDVFWHNLHFLGSYHCNTEQDMGIRPDSVPLTPALSFNRPNFCLAVFAYRKNPGSFPIDGTDRDLLGLRQSIALHFSATGHCDIAGHGWPETTPIISVSGYGHLEGGHWWDEKLSLLTRYRFNVCLENTRAPAYCTEKIWHSICAGTLPIYASRDTTIYQTFPKNSFVDVDEFSSPESLLAYLKQMGIDEYSRRLSACHETMLRAHTARRSDPNAPLEITERAADAIIGLAGGAAVSSSNQPA